MILIFKIPADTKKVKGGLRFGGDLSLKNMIYPDELEIAANQHLKEKNYWINKLSGNPGKVNFSYDHYRPGTGLSDRDAGLVELEFPGEIAPRLIKLSKESDHSLHIILVAGVVLLLGKFTGSRDIVVGVPIYRQEIEGEFINKVLPIRSFPGTVVANKRDFAGGG